LALRMERAERDLAIVMAALERKREFLAVLERAETVVVLQ